MRNHWKRRYRRSLAFWNVDLSSTGFLRELSWAQGCVCRKYTLGSSIPQNLSGRKAGKSYQAEHCRHLGFKPPGGAQNIPQNGPPEGQMRNYPSAFFSLWSRIAQGVFITLHHQDGTCFTTAKWFPEGILRDGKRKAPGQKARARCWPWSKMLTVTLSLSWLL